MTHFLLSVTFGWLMFACHQHQTRYNRSFAVLAAAFFGLAGLRARDGIPKVFMNPALNALGRGIVGQKPPERTSERSRLGRGRSPFARR
jgi:hypothetical protein